MLGLQFDRLTVISEHSLRDTDGKKRRYCKCRCSCGGFIYARKDSLKRGTTKSCGCLLRESARLKAKDMGLSNVSHNMSRTRIYKIWSNMKDRCNKPTNKDYKNYGMRGISYDKSWEDFTNFYNDIGKYYKEGLTLERINVNKNYSKSNCKWVSMYEQQANKQTTMYLTVKGKTKRVVEFAKDYNISSKIIYQRLKRGWSDEDCVLPPYHRR